MITVVVSASLQVSSSRPVFNSTYSSPVYNYNDKSFNFQYIEFQNLVYNPIQFESNLDVCFSISCLYDFGYGW